MNNDFLIRVVDDDPEICNALEFLFQTDGWNVISYPDGQACMDNDDLSRPGCFVVDIRMPRMNGLELQHAIMQRNPHVNILFLTAHGDIDLCVQAMREGAKDFLTKPVDEERLLKTISEIEQHGTLSVSPDELRTHWESLTPREREILPMVAQGLLNRAIADRLGLSFRTVQTHRQLGMKALGVSTVAELNQFLAQVKDS